MPALRDTLSLANELSGFRVVSKDYEKTKVYERAVLINLAAQKLYYPAGYFEQTSLTAVPSPTSQIISLISLGLIPRVESRRAQSM